MGFDEYLKTEGLSEKTVRKYISNIAIFKDWLKNTEGDDYDISNITALDIRDFIADIEKKLMPTTVNGYKSAIKSYFLYLMETKMIYHDPTLKINYTKIQKRVLAKWLSRKDESKLLHALENEKNPMYKVRNTVIVLLMLKAGLRIEEVSSLKSKDLKIDTEEIIVRFGKGHKMRIVPMHADIKIALINYFESFTIDSELVFNITDRAIRNVVYRYGSAASVEATPHILRHTFCKRLAETGASIEMIAQLAGHESIDTTRIYINPSARDLKKCVDKI